MAIPIYFCLGIFIIGGNALSLTIFGVTLKYGELFMMVLGVFMLPYICRRKFKSIDIPLLAWCLLSILLTIISKFRYGFSFNQTIIAFFYLFRFLYLIFIAYVITIYLKNQGKILFTLKYINVLYIIVCLIGFYQLIFYPIAFDWYAVFEKIGVNWVGDPHTYRLLSTDFDPNYLSCCLLIGVTIDLYILSKRKYRKRWFYYFSILLFAVTILLTKSRSGIVGFGIIFILFFLYSIRLDRITTKDILIFFALCAAIIYFLLFSNIEVFVRLRNVFIDPSAGARFTNWAKSWNIVKDINFIGLGYNFYGAYNETIIGELHDNSTSGVDSSLFMLLITTGVIGLVLYLVHLFKLFKASKHKSIKCLIIAMLVVSSFNNLIFYSLWLLPFYVVLFSVANEEKSYCKVKQNTSRQESCLLIYSK